MDVSQVWGLELPCVFGQQSCLLCLEAGDDCFTRMSVVFDSFAVTTLFCFRSKPFLSSSPSVFVFVAVAAQNNFTGSFPSQTPPGIALGKKCHILEWTLTGNSGLVGTIPDWFFSWCNRIELVIFSIFRVLCRHERRALFVAQVVDRTSVLELLPESVVTFKLNFWMCLFSARAASNGILRLFRRDPTGYADVGEFVVCGSQFQRVCRSLSCVLCHHRQHYYAYAATQPTIRISPGRPRVSCLFDEASTHCAYFVIGKVPCTSMNRVSSCEVASICCYPPSP